MAGRIFLAVCIAIASLDVIDAAPTSKYDFYPDIADITAASPLAVKFFRQFFTAKTLDSPDLVNLYNTNGTLYYDSTLGIAIGTNRSAIVKNVKALEAHWAKTAPNAKCYPLRILGDTIHGAIAYFVDTPKLFGAEIRTLTTFDFTDGLVSRQLDTWDGRGNSVKTGGLATNAPYPDLGLPGLPEKATPEMKSVASKLNAALSSGNADATAALFSYDGIFEDYTLRSRIEGRISILSWLSSVIRHLPYGPGTQVTHVLGSSIGGGFEWRPSGETVRYGVTALELDSSGLITRFTAMWDGSRVTQAAIEALAKAAPLITS